METRVNYTPEASLADRLALATEQLETNLALMKERESSATPAELAALQRKHSELLRIWSGLKVAAEAEEYKK